MTRRFLTYVSWFLLAFLVLVTVATILLRLVFSPAKVRGAATAQIRTHLNRDAQIGPVELHPFGLALHRVKLSETPGFAAGTFLVVETVRVRWSLLPLLRRRLVLQEILLESPQVNLTRRPDGKHLNISDLLRSGARPGATPAVASPGTAASAPQPAPAPNAQTVSAQRWAWHVQRIDLRDGLIQFNDQSPAGQSVALRRINLAMWDFSSDRAKGRLHVDTLESPFYKAQSVEAHWELTGLSASLGGVSGTARIRQGPGSIENTSRLIAAGQGTKLAFLPLLLLRKIGTKELKEMPSVAHIKIDEIRGNYIFEHGTMNILEFDVKGPELSMKADGRIHLGTGALAVQLQLHTSPGRVFTGTELSVNLSGTLAKPESQVISLKQKNFKAKIKQLFGAKK